MATKTAARILIKAVDIMRQERDSGFISLLTC